MLKYVSMFLFEIVKYVLLSISFLIAYLRLFFCVFPVWCIIYGNVNIMSFNFLQDVAFYAVYLLIYTLEFCIAGM